MPRKRSVGRPRKVEKREAGRNQKAQRRARLQEIGLVEVRMWSTPAEAALRRRQSRENVAQAEYDDVVRTLGEAAAEPLAAQLRKVLEENCAEVREEFERSRLAKLQELENERRAARQARAAETPQTLPVFSFQGGRFPG